jgi:chemotaxis protein methyltransferase CheR
MLSKECDYEYLRELVQTQSHNVIDHSYDEMFETRLASLMVRAGVSTLSEFVAMLRRQPSGPMHRMIAEKMTINETSFFRDHDAFNTLRDEVLPRIFEQQKHKRTLRIWSAASASGQEAYSIAMMLEESAPDILHRWDVQILGTDYSSDMVKYAQAGRYKRLEINRGLPARMMVKHFVRDREEWEISPELRRLCHFQQMNLYSAWPPMPQFDLVLLRNVLLYFSPQDRLQLLNNVHRRMAPHGCLLLGNAEQASGAEKLLQPVLRGRTYFYRLMRLAA